MDFRGRYKEKGKKREKGRSKSSGRHKSPRNSKEKCWNCGKVKKFRRDYKEEKNKKKENNDSDDKSKNYSQEDGGDSFNVALVTHVGHIAWLINYGAPFHMTSH